MKFETNGKKHSGVKSNNQKCYKEVKTFSQSHSHNAEISKNKYLRTNRYVTKLSHVTVQMPCRLIKNDLQRSIKK